MWLVKKFRKTFKDFNVKWNTNCKKWWKSQCVKFLNMKKNYIGKISMHLTIKLFILWWLFFNFNFDITMTYFLSPHFSFFVCDKHSVIISKVHNESNFFIETHPWFSIIFSINYIIRWIMKKLKILMFDMILHFKFIYNLKKYNYESSNSPPNYAFTQGGRSSFVTL
jgi:hypothetical protein